MSLWWLQPGWTSAACSCGATIWPEGDPDWGQCYSCFSAHLEQQQYEAALEAEYAASVRDSGDAQ